MPRKNPARAVAAPKKGVRLQFFGEVVGELKKAVWPTRQETFRLTMMVLAVSAAVGLFLGAVDYGFTQLARLMFPSS
ncbi:MAG: preprotein translocase subunit SecE [Chloroflexota bacterium]